MEPITNHKDLKVPFPEDQGGQARLLHTFEVFVVLY